MYMLNGFVSEMTYTVSSGTLNSTVPYHTMLNGFLCGSTFINVLFDSVQTSTADSTFENRVRDGLSDSVRLLVA